MVSAPRRPLQLLSTLHQLTAIHTWCRQEKAGGGERIRGCCWDCFFQLAKKHHAWMASAWVAVPFDQLSYQLCLCFALHSLYMLVPTTCQGRTHIVTAGSHTLHPQLTVGKQHTVQGRNQPQPMHMMHACQTWPNPATSDQSKCQLIRQPNEPANSSSCRPPPALQTNLFQHTS
jgi:hypothetical protein